MEQKKSEFDKVLGAWDILVIAFGAMIGWGWVVSSGSWIQKGGVVGASIAFAIGGVMIFFIGLTYAELTAAMPQCGGEHVFSYKAMGPNGSFICTWAIILGYVSVTCFEACAFPTIITYLWPGFLKGYMYSVPHHTDQCAGRKNSSRSADGPYLYHRRRWYPSDCGIRDQRRFQQSAGTDVRRREHRNDVPEHHQSCCCYPVLLHRL